MIIIKKITKIDRCMPARTVENKLRVAAYCRVSTACDAQLESLETQKAHYESYINSRTDWLFAGVYYDEGVTGTKADKRPGLMRLMNDCKAKKIDFVITKSISRFSRNTMDCLEIVRTLLNLNIPIYFEKENINTGSMESELFLSVLSTMAEEESVSISANSKWSIKKRFENGTYTLSSVPYGYIRENGKIKLNSEQASVVKRIFKELLSGKGMYSIAKELNDEQVPTQKGGRWTSTGVHNILTNERYIGDCIFQKTYTDSNFNRHKNDGELNRYLIQNHHEAIISRKDFEAAAALIKQRAIEKGIERDSDKYQQRYVFSEKIICGECGNTFRRRNHKGKYSSYVAWVCNTHLSDTSKCHMLFVRDDMLKLAFATMLNKLVFSYRMVLKPYLTAIQNNTADEALLRIQYLEKQLDQNAEQRETLYKLMAQGYIDRILYTQESNELLSQADDFRSEIEALNNTVTGDTTKVYETERLINFCKRGEMLKEFNDDLFELFVDHIYIYTRKQVGFVMRCGLTFKEMI